MKINKLLESKVFTEGVADNITLNGQKLIQYLEKNGFSKSTSRQSITYSKSDGGNSIIVSFTAIDIRVTYTTNDGSRETPFKHKEAASAYKLVKSNLKGLTKGKFVDTHTGSEDDDYHKTPLNIDKINKAPLRQTYTAKGGKGEFRKINTSTWEFTSKDGSEKKQVRTQDVINHFFPKDSKVAKDKEGNDKKDDFGNTKYQKGSGVIGQRFKNEKQLVKILHGRYAVVDANFKNKNTFLAFTNQGDRITVNVEPTKENNKGQVTEFQIKSIKESFRRDDMKINKLLESKGVDVIRKLTYAGYTSEQAWDKFQKETGLNPYDPANKEAVHQWVGEFADKVYNIKKSFYTPIKEDTSYEWKPNTSFKHIKDIYNKVKANDYQFANNEHEEFMKAVDKAHSRGYKPEECRQIKDWWMDVRKNTKKNESFEKDGGPFWYFTKHGLGPGMLPKGVNVVDTKEDDNFGTYIALDKVLTTQELKEYELVEKRPEMKESKSDEAENTFSVRLNTRNGAYLKSMEKSFNNFKDALNYAKEDKDLAFLIEKDGTPVVSGGYGGRVKYLTSWRPNMKEDMSHFEFTSGANPYIAKTKKEADRVKRNHGDSAKFIKSVNGIDYYKVDDEEKDLFSIDEAFKPTESGIQSVKCYNRYNYTIQELRVDNDNKTFERGNFTAGKADKKTQNRQEYEDIVDSLKELGYTEIKSDYRSLRNKTRKGIPTNEGIYGYEYGDDHPEARLDRMQRKTSGYGKCYEIVKKARTSKPVDWNTLDDARDHFGYDLYKMCLDDVLKEMNESLSESIDVDTIADYITDHYDFDNVDDKYACINSIKDSHKDTISEEELEQFIGSHNGKDKVAEGWEPNPNNADISWRPYDNEKGQVMADKWYAKHYPDDEVGIEQLKYITLDDALKDRSILDNCDTQVRDRVYAQLDKYLPLSVESPMYKKVNEASYGGAFDISDDQYFTRDDLNDFAEEVLNHINETFKTQFDAASCYIDDGVLEVCVTNDEYGDYIHSEKIDMRKIKEPWHLKRAYAFEFASQLINDITQSNDGIVEGVNSSSYEFDDDVDELTYYYDDEIFKDKLENSPYTEIDSKQVPDSDGFMTDYTMYMNINTGEYVFVFGDKDIYRPEDGYFDWECETKEEAEEWFDNYHGFEESEFDDFEESYEVDKVFSAACNNRMDYMKKGFEKGKINPNDRFNRFNSDHSYIMGALRNGNKEMVKYLQDQGGTILDDEQDEYNRLMGEDVEKSPIIHKKSDGSYLVSAENSDGYVAYNKDDVCMGNISANNENEAKSKFNSNNFDE